MESLGNQAEKLLKTLPPLHPLVHNIAALADRAADIVDHMDDDLEDVHSLLESWLEAESSFFDEKLFELLADYRAGIRDWGEVERYMREAQAAAGRRAEFFV